MKSSLASLSIFMAWNTFCFAQDVQGLPNMNIRESKTVLSALCPAPVERATTDLIKIGFEKAWQSVVGAKIDLVPNQSNHASVQIEFKLDDKNSPILVVRKTEDKVVTKTETLPYSEHKEKLENSLQVFYGFEPQEFGGSKIRAFDKVILGTCRETSDTFSRAKQEKANEFSGAMPYKLVRDLGEKKEEVPLGESLIYLIFQDDNARKILSLDSASSEVCLFQRDDSPNAKYRSRKLDPKVDTSEGPLQTQAEQIFKLIEYLKEFAK